MIREWNIIKKSNCKLKNEEMGFVSSVKKVYFFVPIPIDVKRAIRGNTTTYSGIVNKFVNLL